VNFHKKIIRYRIILKLKATHYSAEYGKRQSLKERISRLSTEIWTRDNGRRSTESWDRWNGSVLRMQEKEYFITEARHVSW